MTDLDTLVRDALNLQASRAPHPDTVRARLDARLRTRPHAGRARRVLLPVAAAVAAAGVAAGVSVLGVPAPWTPVPDLRPATSTGPDVARSGAATDPRTLPLRFSPTALPDGLHEVGRSFAPDGVQRTWAARTMPLDDSGGDRLDFWLATGPDEAAGTPASVAGRPGRLLDAGDKLVIEWEVVPGTWAGLLSIGTGLDAKGLVALAASVKPDPRTAVFPLNAGFGPEQTPGRTVVRNGPQNWLATETVVGTTVAVGTEPLYQVAGAASLPAEKLVVGGRPARFVPAGDGHPYAELVVSLADGRFLSVAVNAVAPPASKGGPTATPGPGQAPATRETVVAIAERVRWSEPSFA